MRSSAHGDWQAVLPGERARSAASQEGGLEAAGTPCSEPRTLPVSKEAASTGRPRQGRWPQGREEPTSEAGVTQQPSSERRGKGKAGGLDLVQLQERPAAGASPTSRAAPLFLKGIPGNAFFLFQHLKYSQGILGSLTPPWRMYQTKHTDIHNYRITYFSLYACFTLQFIWKNAFLKNF